MNEIINFRHRLHQFPELSEVERETAQAVAVFLDQYRPSQLKMELGSMKTGLFALYEGKEPGPTLMFRCELDALPIQERNDHLLYCSRHRGVSHMCGHDGHMATLCGVAKYLFENPLKKGKVALVFQPAEESGTGAHALCLDEDFKALKPDYVFGFHNIPKYPLHSAILRKNVFAAASTGFIIKLKGETSHSSYPENGKSPLACALKISDFLKELPASLASKLTDKVVVTLSYLEVGEVSHGPNFGTAPGDARIMGILRGFSDVDLKSLKEALGEYVKATASHFDLGMGITFHEEFPVTKNGTKSYEILEEVIGELGLDKIYPKEPFRWSEDFSYYTQNYESTFFGLGAGLDQPQLHHDTYDYPDALIETGVEIYKGLIAKILK